MFAPFKIVALLLLTLWLPATLHCGLEAAGVALAGHDAHHAAGKTPCAADSCDLVEGGDYVKTAVLARALPPPTVWPIHLLIAPVLVDPFAGEAVGAADDSPELAVLRRTWQFVQRTALPARAPGGAV